MTALSILVTVVCLVTAALGFMMRPAISVPIWCCWALPVSSPWSGRCSAR